MSCSYRVKENCDCMCNLRGSEYPNYAAEEVSLFLKLQSEIMPSPSDMKVSLDESIDLGIEILVDDNPAVNRENLEMDTDCEVLWVKHADFLKPSGDQSPKELHVIKNSKVHPQEKTTPKTCGFSNEETERMELDSISLQATSTCNVSSNLEQTNAEGPKLRESENEKKTSSYNCPFCQISLLTNHELKVHLLEHVNVTKSNSDVHNGITTRQRLDHRVGKNKSRKRHKCVICRKVFLTHTDLRWHINITHAGDRPYKCQLCFKNYKRQTHLTRHELTHWR